VSFDLDHAFGAIGRLLGLDEPLDTVSGIRRLLDGIAAFANDDLPQIGDFIPGVTYREIGGEALTLDVSVPQRVTTHPLPVMVYLHGGAWVWGSPATHRKLTHRFAERGFLVLSVDYRLAPEHPFPAGFSDCLHAVHFAARNAARWGGDPERIVVAGDSAGANLAAATAIALAGDSGAPRIDAVGLIYGVFDFRGFGDDVMSRLLLDAYLGGDDSLVNDPRVSPVLRAGKLPPAHVLVGTGDDLVDDARALRDALKHAGATVEYREYESMPHGFVQMEFLPDARRAIDALAAFLPR